MRTATVGQRLRDEREKQNKNPADVARALGFDRSVLSRIECGLRKLTLVEAENFAVFYEIEWGRLATWKDQRAADETKKLEAKLESERILTKEEFAIREEESKAKRKSERLRKRMSRAHDGIPSTD